MLVRNLDTLKADLRARRATGKTWREIAREFDGIPAGTLCAIAKGYEPKKPSMRRALGLPAMQPAPVCPRCGVVHTRQCRTLPAWVERGVAFLRTRERR